MLRHIDFRFSQLQGIISCKENGMYVRKNSIFTASGEKKSLIRYKTVVGRPTLNVLRRVETSSFYFFWQVGLSIFSYYILQGRRRGFFQFFFLPIETQQNIQFTKKYVVYFLKFFKHICQVRTANMYKCLCYTVSVFFYYIPTFTIMQCNYTYINWCINHSMFISFSY